MYVTQILIIVLHVLITLVSICRDKSLSSLRCFALFFLYESNIKAIKKKVLFLVNYWKSEAGTVKGRKGLTARQTHVLMRNSESKLKHPTRTVCRGG